MVGKRASAVLVIGALLVGSCGDGDGEDVTGPGDGRDTTTTSPVASTPETTTTPTPEELATQLSVPVPEGMRLVSTEEDSGGGAVTFELAYDGDPDVDGYRQAMLDVGWAIESEGPLASYGWCLRLGEVAREALARLGIVAGPLVAYVELTVGRIQWQIGAADRQCVIREGLNAPGD